MFLFCRCFRVILFLLGSVASLELSSTLIIISCVFFRNFYLFCAHLITGFLFPVSIFPEFCSQFFPICYLFIFVPFAPIILLLWFVKMFWLFNFILCTASFVFVCFFFFSFSFSLLLTNFEPIKCLSCVYFSCISDIYILIGRDNYLCLLMTFFLLWKFQYDGIV